jgi:hypothetical protein
MVLQPMDLHPISMCFALKSGTGKMTCAGLVRMVEAAIRGC